MKAVSTTLIALLLLLVRPATADERILGYDIEVAVAADGRLDVVERITARAEGLQIRRGLYRDFPTRYRDRFGNRVVAGFDVVSLLRDGQPEPYFTERLSNGIRVNFGNDDLLPVPAEYAYTLRYETTRQIGFFADHDELYWNAIGTGWVFPIDASHVEVRLPEPVPADQLAAEAYTGPQGAQGQAYSARIVEPGVAAWDLTQPLAPREGFTIVLSFPKGVVTPPTALQRAWWLLADNRGVLVALGGFALLLVFETRRWRRVGRDPRRGVVIARYEPPEGHTPAELRYVQRMGYDARCLSSEVLALAVAGHVLIDRDDGIFRDTWSLERRDPDPSAPPPTPAQRALLARLFVGGRPRVELKKSNATTLSEARRLHSKALDSVLHLRYFERNTGSTMAAGAIAAATTVAAFLISGGAGVPAIVAVAALMFGTVLIFGRLVRKPTEHGRDLLDEIEGLKLYLSVAERDELERLPGPGAAPLLDAQRYEALLPFAVALEVEDAWTAKFTAAAGAAAAEAAANNIHWYRGGGGDSLGGLSRAIGSSFSSQIASASSPPGSSSGSGGGGSSGGGGGGGGGGGR
jgi:uncharacterized membrane protein YgcG